MTFPHPIPSKVRPSAVVTDNQSLPSKVVNLDLSGQKWELALLSRIALTGELESLMRV